MDTKVFIQKIINIGENEKASGEQVRELLPDYPTLRGGEDLFKIGWANAERYLGENFVDFVKGLHYVELQYRKMTDNDFGFGSPSPTEKVIQAIEKKDKGQADELRTWIAENGGNYYIKSTQ